MYDFHTDAKLLWEYHHLHQPLQKADCILGFGSHDLHVAERAAELYLAGYGEYIIFTGGFGRITKNIWNKPEAIKFAEIAGKRGVPQERILTESESTNTGENIRNTKRLLQQKQLSFSNYLVVDKPFKERRIYATLKKQWSDLDFRVTSPQNTYEEYYRYYQQSEQLHVADFLNILVGDLQRIDLYGRNGFQIPQEIPPDVWAAYWRLVNAGFDKQLIAGCS